MKCVHRLAWRDALKVMGSARKAHDRTDTPETRAALRRAVDAYRDATDTKNSCSCKPVPKPKSIQPILARTKEPKDPPQYGDLALRQAYLDAPSYESFAAWSATVPILPPRRPHPPPSAPKARYHYFRRLWEKNPTNRTQGEFARAIRERAEDAAQHPHLYGTEPYYLVTEKTLAWEALAPPRPLKTPKPKPRKPRIVRKPPRRVVRTPVEQARERAFRAWKKSDNEQTRQALTAANHALEQEQALRSTKG